MFLKKCLTQIVKYPLPLGFALIISLMIFTSFYSVLQMKTSAETIIDSVEQQNLNSELLNTMTYALLQRSLIAVEMLSTDDPFVTERTILDISKESIEELNEFRKHGMKISIDDFGTGYSSLSYLKKLPITTIKIDKSFIAGLPDDKDDQELVKTIITLGHSLKLDIVAEGVETVEQLEFLKSHACDIAQGYYLHRPLEHKKIPILKIAA